jgi:hypothetical protein
MYFGQTKKKKILFEKNIFFGGHIGKNDQKVRARACNDNFVTDRPIA